MTDTEHSITSGSNAEDRIPKTASVRFKYDVVLFLSFNFLLLEVGNFILFFRKHFSCLKD